MRESKSRALTDLAIPQTPQRYIIIGSPSRIRTCDIWINSPPFYRLNYRGINTIIKMVLTGNALSSQSVSRQVLSAYECLTTVFGMGTGGTTQLSSPDIHLNVMHIQNYTEEISMSNILALKDKPSIY